MKVEVVGWRMEGLCCRVEGAGFVVRVGGARVGWG